MGVFNRNELCGTCGAKIGLSGIKIKDGVICVKCVVASEYAIGEIGKKNQIEINNRLKLMNEKEDNLLGFVATKVIGKKLEFDDKKKIWLSKPTGVFSKSKVPKVRKYSDILDFDLLEDGETLTTKKGFGRAVVGGVLFGGVGAIVGGVTGKNKNKNVCNSLKLKITLKDLEEPNIYINFINSPTKKDGFLYKTFAKLAQEAVSVLSIILEENSKQLDVNNPNTKFSVADELLKFKSLLDQGIVTQDEFDFKKKELLKL